MARISIEHVEFRGSDHDQPRFKPSAALVRLGFKSRPLRHGDGRWFTATEALDFIEREIEPEIARRRAAAAAGKRLRPSRPRYVTVSEIIEAYLDFKRQDGAPASTLTDYRKKALSIEKFDPELYTAPAVAISPQAAYRLYLSMSRRKGLATAVGSIRILSASFGHAIRTGTVEMAGNPCARLKMKAPAPRVRAGSVQEMESLIAAAHALGRQDVATMIVLGLWTGQRQGDRRAMIDSGESNGRIVIRQSKTGKIVSIPKSPQVVEALATARKAKAALPFRIVDAAIVVNRDTGRQFVQSTYSHLFANVRKAAVKGIRDPENPHLWLVEPCPTLADFLDLDLRDTAVTWLVRGGCDLFEVASITGHELDSIHTILKHYLADHPERADSAIAKMVAWYEVQTGAAERS